LRRRKLRIRWLFQGFFPEGPGLLVPREVTRIGRVGIHSGRDRERFGSS